MTSEQEPRELEGVGFEVTGEEQSFSIHVPEISRDRVVEWVLKPFRGRQSEDHPDYSEFVEKVADPEAEEPARFLKRIGSKLDRENIIPDAVKSEAGKKTLKYLGAITAAVVIEEAARRSVKHFRNR